MTQNVLLYLVKNVLNVLLYTFTFPYLEAMSLKETLLEKECREIYDDQKQKTKYIKYKI